MRYVLSAALFLPVLIAALTVSSIVSTTLAAPSLGITSQQLLVKRPIAQQPEAPPTLAPPARPTATPLPPPPTPTPRAATYVVKAGDELKYIAADHGVNIFKLIEANKIDDPDSLRVGQVLRIPEN